MNKKGQIATGMTWVVATLIILFILAIFLIASGVINIGNIGSFSGKGVVYLKFYGQQESLFAIAKNPEITNLISSGNYDDIENKLKIILPKLGRPEISGGWNLAIFKNNEKVKEVKTFSFVTGWYDSQNFYLRLKDNKDIQLRLYLECKDDSCYDHLK